MSADETTFTAWREACGPEDRVAFAYLGLDRVLGTRVSRDELLACARDALERAAFYRERWVSGSPVDGVRLGHEQARRLRSIVTEGHGAVVCTFQIGPFLQLPFAVSELDLPVMLLMDPDNFECGMEVCTVSGITPGGVPLGYWPKQDSGTGLAPTCPPVHFVSSTDPSTTWKMAQWLKGGKVVFAYLDGNQGVDSEPGGKTSVVTDFLGVDIWVRKGLAYLAGFMGVPLVFVVCREEEGRHVVHLSPPVRRRPAEPLEAFCRRGVRSGFRLLEAYVRQDVGCWSEWGRLHHWTVRRRKGPVPANTMSAEEALRRRLTPEARTVHLRLGGQEVLVNHASGAAVVFTPLVRNVLHLAGTGCTAEEIVDRLNADYEEDALLEAIHALAEDAFLRTSGP